MVLNPKHGEEKLAIDLHSDLAGILSISAGKLKKAL